MPLHRQREPTPVPFLRARKRATDLPTHHTSQGWCGDVVAEQRRPGAMAPSRSATAALQKKAASKQSASKKPAPKKAAPKKPLKPKPTISEQIVKMKEKPKSNWIKADFVKYSELLEKMHAGAAEEPPTEEPVFPPASDEAAAHGPVCRR